MKRFLTIALMSCMVCNIWAAKVNTEKTIKIGGKSRNYVLYVPNNVKEHAPLVFSLHGAGGMSSNRQPFQTSVADKAGCIVVYPQGLQQNYYVLGMSATGWDATGKSNIDLDFFKAIIEEVAASYDIDRNRIYCCGFSNGGMMTYSNSTTAADIFAAFASISGFQYNEYHQRCTGAKPVPFLHIHGKADDFVKYAYMPTIRDKMVARNGCNLIPQVTEVAGKYRKSVYEAGEGGFPYVYYEMDGMGHSPETSNTEEGNSTQTMWNFMSQFSLDDDCDKTLKWRCNPDTEGFELKEHGWKRNTKKVQYMYGTAKQSNNADGNVYHSLQFEPGNYKLILESTGEEGNTITVKVDNVAKKNTIFKTIGKAGARVVMPFSVDVYSECKITITKSDPGILFTNLAIHSSEEPAVAENCVDDETTSIQSINSEEDTTNSYTLFGTMQTVPAKGISIVNENGKTKKILVK